MENYPLISVIVPIYKTEKYMKNCVNSIINQTYKNLQIILVDDGSPDQCSAICDEFALMDSRIIVLHKSNGGLSDARNSGIEIATGEYLGFVDSDDYIHPQMYELLLKAIQLENVDISVCSYITGAEESYTEFQQQKCVPYDFSIITGKEYLLEGYGDIAPIVAWNKLYKRESFSSLRYPVGKLHEDEFITYQILYFSQKIAISTTPLYYYYQRSDSIIGSGFDIRKLAFLEALNQRMGFYNMYHEEELYLKTVYYYLCAIKEKYCQIILRNEEYHEIKKQLREDYNKIIYKDFFRIHCKTKDKIRMLLFYISPNIYIKAITFIYQFMNKKVIY